MGGFVDFRVIVRKVAHDREGRYVTVVAGAPVSSFGQTFDWFGGGDKWAQSLTRSDSDVRVECDGQGRYRLAQEPGHTASATARSWTQTGRALFDIIFPQGSTAYDLLGRSCQCANLEGAYLRLQLDLHPDLSNLPWEMMLPPLSGSWVCEVAQTRWSIVRYLGDIYSGADRPPAAPVSGQSVIVVCSDPEDIAQYDITNSLFRERNRIRGVFDQLSNRMGHVEVDGPDTFQELIQKVDRLERDSKPVVGLHFMGHGGIDGNGSFFVGRDSDGKATRIYEAELRAALHQTDSIQWVIFNACTLAEEPLGCPLAGLATSIAVLKSVPTVIAFKRPVETTKAEALASKFYEQAVRDGEPIEKVIRSIQIQYRNPGGLVVLQQSVRGRVQDIIPVRRQEPAAAPLVQPRELPRIQVPRVHETAAAPTPAEMVLVEGGSFYRGLDEQHVMVLVAQFQAAGLALDLESARQTLLRDGMEQVELDAFHMDKTLVTNSQFAAFVSDTNFKTDAERMGDSQNWRVNDVPDKADHPVVNVSYGDARAYCEWAGKRLPTADEWRRAYRGTDERLYPWGDQFDVHLCNSADGNGSTGPTPVDRFPAGASPCGCLDIIGNVEEWTTTIGSNNHLIILGGSWAMTCQVFGLPVTHRLGRNDFYTNDLGFRCARDAT